MNERISKLIRQADVHILPDESEYGHTIVGLEKFAELIVRECATIADTAQAEDMGWDIGEIIKEHFGVE
jgi:hypothetical protein